MVFDTDGIVFDDDVIVFDIDGIVFDDDVIVFDIDGIVFDDDDDDDDDDDVDGVVEVIMLLGVVIVMRESLEKATSKKERAPSKRDCFQKGPCKKSSTLCRHPNHIPTHVGPTLSINCWSFSSIFSHSSFSISMFSDVDCV